MFVYVVSEEGSFFLVRESAEYQPGDEYDANYRRIVGRVVLPDVDTSKKFSALMQFEGVEELILKVMEAAYLQGRSDQRAHVRSVLRSLMEE